MTSNVSLVVGVIGNICSVLVLLSPIPTVRRIIRNRSTEEFKSLPFICTLLNSSLWTYYGLTKSGSLIIVPVNGFGVLCEVVYITIFLVYAAPKIRLQSIKLVVALDLIFLTATILITRLMMGQSLRIDTVGVMCMVLSIAMYASPLAAMKQVVTTKSVEFFPFFVSLSLFSNGGSWTIYALLTRDYFIGIPSGIGFILGVAQLVLIMIYRRSKLPQDAEQPLIYPENEA